MSRMSRSSVSVVPEAKGPQARSLFSIMAHDTHHTGHSKAHKKMAFGPMFTILRRLAVIAAAIRYINVCLAASWYAWDILVDTHNTPETLRVFTTSLMGGYMGDGLIRDSPLVQNVLGGDTTPRDYAIFLESATNTSSHNCSAVPLFNSAMYNYDFLSNAYQEMVNDSQYNITDLVDLELVTIVIDCTFTQLVRGDPSAARIFNVVRSRTDPGDVYLMMVTLTVQNTEARDFNKQNPGFLSRLTIFQDMRVGVIKQFFMLADRYPYQRSLDFEVYEPMGAADRSYIQLRSIPRDPLTQPVKKLLVVRKRGFYNGQEQANVRHMHFIQDGSDAKRTLTKWEWFGEAVTFDMYAWVHLVHLFFAAQTLFSLMILALMSYQKFRTGKVWIGDPFSSVSTASLVLRGVLVVFSMYVNSFWMINEYCMSFAASVTGTQSIRIHQELLHADIMVVYLALVGLLSSIFRERIDPSVAIFLFELIHAHRLAIVKSAPAILNEIVAYSNAQYYNGVVKVTPALVSMSPFRFWTAYQLPPRDFKFLISSFFPKAILLAIIAGFAIMRKIYRHYHPDPTRHRSSLSPERSTNDKTAMTMRGIVTHFEISTGAELQTRFGLISDYNNYVYFKGMKFASADGVYCSGYVVANGKFLVSSKDLLTIIVMKLVGARFANVYVYEVDGNNVKDSARLVYPKTFMWSDLWRLNVMVLL